MTASAEAASEQVACQSPKLPFAWTSVMIRDSHVKRSRSADNSADEWREPRTQRSISYQSADRPGCVWAISASGDRQGSCVCTANHKEPSHGADMNRILRAT